MKNRVNLLEILKIPIFILLIFVWGLMKFLPFQGSEKLFVFFFFPLAMIYGIVCLVATPPKVIDIKIGYIVFTGFVGHLALVSIGDYAFVANSNLIAYKGICAFWSLCFAILSFVYGVFYRNNKSRYSKIYKPELKFIKTKNTYEGWIKAYYFSALFFLLLSIGCFVFIK